MNEEQGVEEQVEGTPKITFGQFNEFYKVNSDLDNAEMYKSFPTVKEGTLRSWKAKAKNLTETPPPEEVPDIPETPEEPSGEPEVIPPTPPTEKELADLIAKKVQEALQIDRMDPSEGIPVDSQVSREVIAKNWHEVIV